MYNMIYLVLLCLEMSIAVSMSDSAYNNWKQIKFKMESSPALEFPITSFLNVHIPSGTQHDAVRQVMVAIETRKRNPGTFFFDITANSWLDIKVEGEQPSIGTEPTATAFPNLEASPIIFFGGNAHENATWRLETNQVSGVTVFQWKRGAPGPYPSRIGHAAAAIDKKLIVYGGVVKQYAGHLAPLVLSDMASYDIDKDEWSDLPQMNDGPCARWSQSYASVFDRYLLIAGGSFYVAELSPDGFAYDVRTNMWHHLPDISSKDENTIVCSTGVFRRYEQDAHDWVLLTKEDFTKNSEHFSCRPEEKMSFTSSVLVYRFSSNNVTRGQWLTIGVSTTVFPNMPQKKFSHGALPQVRLKDDTVAIMYGRTVMDSTTFENGMWFYLSQKQNYNWEILPRSQEPGPLAGFTFTVANDRKHVYIYGGFRAATSAGTAGNVDGTAWNMIVNFSIDPGVYKWERYLPATSVCTRLGFYDAWHLANNFRFSGEMLSSMSTLRGHTSVAIRMDKDVRTNCLLIFGGVFYYETTDQLALVCPESFLFRVFRRPEGRRRWMTWPSDRAFHSAVIDGSTMFIFGGVRFKTFRSIDVKAFLAEDLWSLTWNQFNFSSNSVWTRYVASECPPTRFGHTAVVAFDVRTKQKQMLIFGGTDFDSTFRDLWQFTLPSGPWSQILYTADSRSRPNLGLRHPTAVMSGRQMLVYGGCRERHRKISDRIDPIDLQCPKNRVSDSLLAFDMYERHWRTLQPSNDMPARYFHGMVLFENKLLVYGGIGSDGAVEDTILTLQPGCNPGEEGDFFTNGCRPCDVGYYSDSGGPACDKCSLFFSTKSHGSSSLTNCSECSEICDFGGTCVATRPNIEYECHCRFPFSGNTCKSFWPLLVFTASVLVSIAVIFLIYKIVQYVKRARRDAENLQERENEIGDLLEGWRIEGDEIKFVEKIGEGGFGEVWLAEYREMQVAVKILNENERLFVDNSNELFQQEIDFMRHLRHPNIVLFLGAGSFQTDGNLFLVTEFVSRGSLHGVLLDGSTSLTVNQKIKFCLDSANGMRFLHELNPPRIHRDLKAANLLVSQNWVVKVSDFGTARRLLKSSKDEMDREISAGDQFPLSDSDDETQPLLLARYKNMSWRHGTSLWKAPELLMQQAYGASVDIYRYTVYNLMLITS